MLSLIRELAEYEKLSHEVEATETIIADALFADNPRLFCDIAEWNGEVAGFAVWFLNFSTFSGRSGIYLEDLLVRPAQRRANEQVFQIDPGAAAEGRKVDEPERKAGRLVIPQRDFAEQPRIVAEQRRANIRLGGFEFVEQLLIFGEFAKQGQNEPRFI